MNAAASPSFGLCFHRVQPAADVVAEARAAEEMGFDELWVIEDLFYTSGPSLAAAALMATDRLHVGIGIMPAAARSPAVAAMEIATLAALAPGRFHAGIGHGVQDWMEQIGLRVESPLTLLDETVTAIRRLLAGERVSVRGRYVSFDDAALIAPPEIVPLVSVGVRGAKSLQLGGRCADGTILAELCSPDYLRWARKQVEIGGGTSRHRITVFCSISVSDDGNEARRRIAPFVAGVFAETHVGLTTLPFYPELAKRAADVGWLDAVLEMPLDWWGQLGPIGTPAEAADYLAAMIDAGADSLTVFPDPDAPLEDAKLFVDRVLSLLR